MSGHSRWHNIRVKKTKVDAQRGKLFAKGIREITVATRQGGKDPEANPRLRQALERAREINMPQENIQKAILRGAGELPGEVYEEFVLEGYGPGGVALLIEVQSDNRQRTVANIRHLLAKAGGSLGEVGCTNWLFERKGIILVRKNGSEEAILDAALEAGAEDFSEEEGEYVVKTAPENLESVKSALASKGEVVAADIQMVPKTTVALSEGEARKILALLSALEEHEDVQAVHVNVDLPEEILKGSV